jgi:hypothetical protein
LLLGLGACEFIFTGNDLVGSGPDASGGGDDSGESGADAPAPCIDVSKDPHNCGACGKDCFGGQCGNGKCTAGVFLTGEDGIFGVAVDATTIYWSTDSGKIARRPIKGGDTETLSTTEKKPGFVAVNQTYVYWTNRDSGEVRRKPLAGGAAETIINGQVNPTGIAAGPSAVLWSEQVPDGAVYALVDGGGRFPQVRGLASPAGVTIINLSATSFVFDVAVEGSGQIGSTGFAGQFAPQITFPDPAGLVYTETAAYFTSPSSGDVVRVTFNPSQGNPEILAPNIQKPQGIALASDQSALYWAENGSGRIGILVF